MKERLGHSFLLLFILTTVTVGYGQDRLTYLADGMTHMDLAAHRQASHDEFYDLFVNTIRDTGFAALTLDIPWIQKYLPSDSSFALYTWELRLDSTHRYFGALEYADATIAPVILEDASDQLQGNTRETLYPDEWMGAVYYNMEELVIGEKTYYLLFGLNRLDPAYNRKVCEVLYLEADGAVSFGAPIFIKKREDLRDDVRKRIVLTFSDPANVVLTYDDSDQMIWHNHILQVPEQSYEGEPLLVQDGTYEVYEKTSEGFVYKEYLFEQNLNRAGEEDDEVKKDQPKRDIMGRPQKKG